MSLKTNYNDRSLEKSNLCCRYSQQLLLHVKSLVENVGRRLFRPVLTHELYIWILFKRKQNPQIDNLVTTSFYDSLSKFSVTANSTMS